MHKALYRTFRPMIFADVVGQEHITRTLKNQISGGNTAHAYLFSGTRGTGKTSTAKIFARSINCISPVDFEPCNECEVCRGIIDESIMDVVEIDAASNNGVDDVRELRENVKYPPSRGRYKVYIIDEVHMLSQGAFNALLKTLEEPPPHVVFILATTEAHKLPATILSRCQRFDFKRIQISDMVERLRFICESVDVCADEKALSLIAMSSQGALRDALSILDQCMSYSSECISYEDVVSLLGTVDFEVISDMSLAIMDMDVKRCMEIVNEIVVWGKDIRHFIQTLIEHFRNIMVMQMKPSRDEMMGIAGHMQELLLEQSSRLTSQEIVRNIKILSKVQNDIKHSTHPRIMLEVALMKLCTPSEDESMDGILSRISRIEKMIQNGEAVKTRPEKTESRISEKTQKQDKAMAKQVSKKSEKIKTGENQDYSCSEKKVSVSKDIDMNVLMKEVLRVIKQDKRVPVQAMLKEGSPAGIENGVLVVVFKDAFDFHKKALCKSETITYIKGVLKRVTGEDVGLRLILESEMDQTPPADESGQESSDEGLEILEDIFPAELIQVKDSHEE